MTISGPNTLSITGTGVSTGITINTLEDRLDDIRNGSSGFSSNVTVNGAQTERDGKTNLDGKSAPSVVEPVLQSSPQNRWGVWLTGFGDFVSIDSEERPRL